jgi:flagellar biosynthesis protein FliQ
MAPPDLIDVVQEGFILSILLTLPVLAGVLVAGLASGLVQMVTKQPEPSLSHVFRIAAVALAVLLAAPWMFARVTGFAERVWAMVQGVGI